MSLPELPTSRLIQLWSHFYTNCIEKEHQTKPLTTNNKDVLLLNPLNYAYNIPM